MVSEATNAGNSGHTLGRQRCARNPIGRPNATSSYSCAASSRPQRRSRAISGAAPAGVPVLFDRCPPVLSGPVPGQWTLCARLCKRARPGTSERKSTDPRQGSLRGPDAIRTYSADLSCSVVTTSPSAPSMALSPDGPNLADSHRGRPASRAMVLTEFSRTRTSSTPPTVASSSSEGITVRDNFRHTLMSSDVWFSRPIFFSHANHLQHYYQHFCRAGRIRTGDLLTPRYTRRCGSGYPVLTKSARH